MVRRRWNGICNGYSIGALMPKVNMSTWKEEIERVLHIFGLKSIKNHKEKGFFGAFTLSYLTFGVLK